MISKHLTKGLNCILIGLFLIFFSCTEEEKTINIENEVFEVGNFFMSELTTEELSNNVVNRFKESNFTRKSTTLKDADGYEIDWENGNYMQVGGQHSYTFPIIPGDSDVGIQNMVYQSISTGGYVEYLYTYEISSEEMLLLADGQPIPLKEKVKKQLLQKLEKIPSTNKGGGDCGYKGWVGTDLYGIKRIYSHKDDCENKIGLGQCRWEDKTYECPEVLDAGNNQGSGGGASSGGGAIGHVTILQRGPSSGDGQSTGIYDNGSNTSGGGGSGGTFTAPLALTKPYYLARDLGFDNDSFEAKFLNANKEVTDETYKYILEENKSEEALDFAREAVKAIIDGGYVDFEELFIETLTPDDDYTFQDSKTSIPSTLTLDNGDSVSVTFGKTKSDNLSANQEVSVDLLEGIKDGLNAANIMLESEGKDKITSIYIMATTNGKHSATSNHSNGTAVDISRINGEKMILSGVTDQIKQLQIGFDGHIFLRENFGPHFKHKYYKSNGTWDYDYNVGGHKDHIHFSVRK